MLNEARWGGSWPSPRPSGTSPSSSADALLEHEIEQRPAALRSSQEQLSAILHTAADAIITIDATGIIQSVNVATERMFGNTAPKMLGQNVKMLMPPPYRQEHDGYLANLRGDRAEEDHRHRPGGRGPSARTARHSRWNLAVSECQPS